MRAWDERDQQMPVRGEIPRNDRIPPIDRRVQRPRVAGHRIVKLDVPSAAHADACVATAHAIGVAEEQVSRFSVGAKLMQDRIRRRAILVMNPEIAKWGKRFEKGAAIH